jgi:phage protein U
MKPPILFILFLYSFQAQLSFAQTTLNDFEIGKLRGKVKSIIETDRNPNDSLSHYETKTYFNEKGNITSNEAFENGILFRKATFTYDSLNRVHEKKWKDKSGVTSDSVLYNYNTDGSWEEKACLNCVMNPSTITYFDKKSNSYLYKQSKNGIELKPSYVTHNRYNRKGWLISSYSKSRKDNFKYDRQGHKLELKIEFKSEGSDVIKYDTLGNQIEVIRQKSDGSLVSHFKSTYNEFNDLTALLIVNAAGKIVGTIHTITYIYDKQNNWIKATIIGKDGICIRERIIEYF